MTEEIMRSLGRLEQSAADVRQDLTEIKADLKLTDRRLGKVEVGQGRLKALAGVFVAAATGGAGWLGLQ